MRILILGGTAFLSAAVAQAAVRRSHDVTCAARGISGKAPLGTEFVLWDRADPVPEDLAVRDFDAVVDVSGSPDQVTAAVIAFPRAHWLFVSTISVYADHSIRHGSPADSPLLPPDFTGVDPESYGERKVACEQRVQAVAERATVVRPGLIVGPGDPTGRFAYWPTRLAQSAEDGRPFLAPLPQADPTQWIDVRDLAEWIVALLESGTTGVFDAIGPAVPRYQFLTEVADAVARVVGARPAAVWTDPDELTARGVAFWSGPDAIPMWIPLEGWEGMMDRDAGPGMAAGLRPRPLTETAADVLEWVRTHSVAVPGLSRANELEVLAGRGLG